MRFVLGCGPFLCKRTKVTTTPLSCLKLLFFPPEALLLRLNQSLRCSEMLCRCSSVTLGPGQDDRLTVFFLWLLLFKCSSRISLLSRLLSVFRQEQLLPLCCSTPLLFIVEIVKHTHACTENQRATFCWKNEAVLVSHSSVSALVHRCIRDRAYLYRY